MNTCKLIHRRLVHYRAMERTFAFFASASCLLFLCIEASSLPSNFSSNSSSLEDYHDAYRAFLVANGVGRTPPMGWNSWNHFFCNIDEWTIRATADALVSTGLAELGYKYVNIDDCWAEGNRDSRGNLVARASTFPSGIKALAEYVHSKGLKLGIYADAGLRCFKIEEMMLFIRPGLTKDLVQID